MSVEWYYEKAGEAIGPVSALELRDLAARGLLTRNDFVWRRGDTTKT